MDVHLWAKVNPDGTIQSVQSTCAQSPINNGPIAVPILAPSDKDNMSDSDRFVPYMEKKRLANSLGNKVDEVAKMMHDLEAMSKTDELQKKLIREYEHNIDSLTKRNQMLEKENLRLKRQLGLSFQKKSKTRSLDVSATSPKYLGHGSLSDEPISFKSMSLSWPDGLNSNSGEILNSTSAPSRKCTQEFDQSDDTKMMFVVQQTLDNVDGPINRRIRSTRSQSIRVDIQRSSHSPVNLDFESRVNTCFEQKSAHADRYSYVEKQCELKLTENDKEAKPDLAQACDVQTEVTQEKYNDKCERPSFYLPLDEYGYLEMTHHGNTVKDNDKLIGDGMSKTNTEVPADSRVDEIHVSHRDLNEGRSPNRIASKPVGIENFTEKCLMLEKDRCDSPEACPGSPRYETIHFTDDDIPPKRPPLPPRRRSTHANKTSINTSTLVTVTDRSQKVGITSCRSELSTDYIESRPTSLPLKPRNSFEEERSPTITNRRDRMKHPSCSLPTLRDGSQSPPTPQELRTVYGSRSSSINDMKKDDALNRLYKDMRTTMEWDKTKKRLMHQSHMNTVDHIEKQLRAVVQEVYKTYQSLGTESRSRQSTKEKVFEKVKDALMTDRSNNTNVVSDYFLIKCIDLVIITTPVQSP